MIVTRSATFELGKHNGLISSVFIYTKSREVSTVFTFALGPRKMYSREAERVEESTMINLNAET